MALTKQIKFLNGRNNGERISAQYTVPYSMTARSRYKHIDELKLVDNKIIKATMGPIDMSIYPYNGLQKYIVTATDENRIDIVAYKIYGDSSLYWILCYFNRIADPLKLPIGTSLHYPDLASVMQYPNPLS
jgi:hypothetical protein